MRGNGGGRVRKIMENLTFHSGKPGKIREFHFGKPVSTLMTTLVLVDMLYAELLNNLCDVSKCHAFCVYARLIYLK
jgi:hypothetical protein